MIDRSYVRRYSLLIFSNYRLAHDISSTSIDEFARFTNFNQLIICFIILFVPRAQNYIGFFDSVQTIPSSYKY